ncbi:MAG: amidase [Acidobacteriota bacterium]|nr:MAG: amidase [Acidobacteriota bacterium]
MSMKDAKESWKIGRRTFLKSSAGGALVAASVGPACTPEEPSSSEVKAPEAGDFVLDEKSIADLQEAMSQGDLSAQEITQLYLQRIDEIDRKGPELRALIEVNPEAVEIAAALDRERREKGPRGPLHGIPIILKDNIDTHDQMTTTAGSLALEGSIPPQDSFVAQRLREAGAVLLGKANLSEWANFRSDYSSSGWSARGGQCRNPYALDRNPCGSSSGSAVAASANLAAATIGTETNGSIVCPSNANGVVGLKPTVGLVSRSGIIPISATQDTAGPITRTVSDAAMVLGALTGIDARDGATKASEGNGLKDYREFLDPDGLKGARIGIARQYFGFNPRVDDLGEEAIRLIEKAGATIVDSVEIQTRRQMGGPSYTVMLYEFKAGLNAYLASLGPNAGMRTLEDIIAFNEANRDLEMPFFEQNVFLESQEKGELSEKEYVDALSAVRTLSREKGLDLALGENDLDAIIAPSGGPAWMTDHVNGDHFSGGSSSPAAISGYPNISVPMGLIHGLPVGLSFFGSAWSESTLIRFAFAFEQVSRARSKPMFLKTLEI